LRARAKALARAGQQHSAGTGFGKNLIEGAVQVVEQAAAKRIVSLGIIERQDRD
jgi:hypothetical protein